LNPRIIQVIQRQINEVIKNPPDCTNNENNQLTYSLGVKYVLNERDILDIQADISGPSIFFPS